MAVADVLFIAGSFCMAIAPSTRVVILGRVLVGLGIGIASVTVPVYLAETAQSNNRAYAVAANVLMITAGQLISFLVNYGLSYVSHTWRWMLGVAAVPAIVQLVGLGLLPESPRWLLSKVSCPWWHLGRNAGCRCHCMQHTCMSITRCNWCRRAQQPCDRAPQLDWYRLAVAHRSMLEWQRVALRAILCG
jgi:MFS family permease